MLFLIQNIFYRMFFIGLVISIVVGCDKEISRSPVEPDPSEGFIYISSIPSGSTIFLNSRNTGRITPDSLSYLDPGIYEISLKRKYYKDTSLTLNLSQDEKKQIEIDYLSNPSMYGNLFLNSQPEGASIILNDSILNIITPYTISNLIPGEYNIKFKIFNHRDAEITALVFSSQTRNYIEELRDTSVWVDYQTNNSGIPTNILTSIAIDYNNVKWIGTQDKGLIRFDEVSFTNYDISNSSIPANSINCISIDNQNKVWVGTNSGIGVFDGTSWINYNGNNSGLTSEEINSIRFDNTGNAFIGTTDGLFKFDGINWTHYNDPLSRNWINDFYIESENKIWLGTKGFGILLLEGGTFTEMSKAEYNYPTYTLSSISSDQLSNIWFCFLIDSSGRAGVSYWNESNFTNYFPGTYLNSFRHIFIDEENNKWVSTSEGLLLFNSQNAQTLFNIQNSLISADLITSSIKDFNGNVWIATQNAGLNKYKPE
jgi:ligand-binding sensor domain-containing protein